MSSSELFIESNFNALYAEIETAKAKKERWPGQEELEVNGFYGGSHQIWNELAAYVEGKTCLEIGPGPCGALACWWWVKSRIFIDPLIEEFKRIMDLGFEILYSFDGVRQDGSTIEYGCRARKVILESSTNKNK